MSVLDIDGISNHNITIRDTNMKVMCLLQSSSYDTPWLGGWPAFALTIKYGGPNERCGSKKEYLQKHSKNIEQWISEQVKVMSIDNLLQQIEVFVGTLFPDIMVTEVKTSPTITYFIHHQYTHKTLLSINLFRGCST